MKKAFIVFGLLTLLAAACHKIELKKEIPSSPRESYNELPK